MADSVLILTALLPEAQALSRSLGLRPAPASFSKHAWAGSLPNGTHVNLAIIGIRAIGLDSVLNLNKFTTFQRIILAGLGGGLDPTLRRGDVVVDSDILLSTPPMTPFQIKFARIHNSQELISIPQEKRTLFSQTQCAAVDMESTAVRNAVDKHRIPLVILRAISDTAADALDPRLMRLIRPDGTPHIPAALSLLARRPWLLPTLLHLNKVTTLCMTNISQIVAFMLATK